MRRERHFTARYRADLVAIWPTRGVVANGRAMILDARPTPRLRALRQNHARAYAAVMPPVRNVTAAALVENGFLKSKDALQSLLPHTGLRRELAWCVPAAPASPAAIIRVGARRIGRWDALIYDGAWANGARR